MNCEALNRRDCTPRNWAWLSVFQLCCGHVVSGDPWVGFFKASIVCFLFGVFFSTFLTAVNLLIFNCPVYGKILSLDRINVSWKTKCLRFD